jgi:hypothetical protein
MMLPGNSSGQSHSLQARQRKRAHEGVGIIKAAESGQNLAKCDPARPSSLDFRNRYAHPPRAALPFGLSVL